MEIDRFIDELEKGREEKGMSWADVTRVCGVTRQTVYKWKRMNYSPRLETMILLLGAVGKKLEVVKI